MTIETQFDQEQLILLESVLAPSEVSAENAEAILTGTPTKELCLKIGSALIQANEEHPVALVLTESECWILRERLSIFASIGAKQHAGLDLKLVLYKLLLAYATEREVGILLESDHQEQTPQEVRDALARRRTPKSRKNSRQG